MHAPTHTFAWALKLRRVFSGISSVRSGVRLVLDIRYGHTRILFPILRLKMYMFRFKVGKYL